MPAPEPPRCPHCGEDRAIEVTGTWLLEWFCGTCAKTWPKVDVRDTAGVVMTDP